MCPRPLKLEIFVTLGPTILGNLTCQDLGLSLRRVFWNTCSNYVVQTHPDRKIILRDLSLNFCEDKAVSMCSRCPRLTCAAEKQMAKTKTGFDKTPTEVLIDTRRNLEANDQVFE